MQAVLDRTSWDVVLDDGSTTRVTGHALHVLFAEQGLVLTRAQADAGEIYDRGRADDEIRESLRQAIAALRVSEARLRISEKLEALGRHAGGIAHDFNNLLSVILSHTELLAAKLEPRSPMHSSIDEIHKATSCAIDLTRQLLTFSREETSEPKIVCPDAVLLSADDMVRRLVGEGIEVVAIFDSTPALVRVHTGAMEQVIINLAVNARDAMSTGGRLTIRTSNVIVGAESVENHRGATPGSYVLLSVTDTGAGMDKPTLAQIFKPFFTTKEKGKGTGLGLATVFDIVRQSGGYVRAQSEPGRGTTFSVYLPRVEASANVG
jgi:signal transduction histidine kinase